MTTRESWGRIPKVSQRVYALSSSEDSGWIRPGAVDGTYLPYGRGRSYGDSCLNDGGTLLETRALNRVISLDREAGIIRVEAGITLNELLQILVPQGLFLPVMTGTGHVTVGGAIANDVHGKNHHRAGTFGSAVRSFLLWRSDGRLLVCSATENAGLFRATIGGLGLTGLILWAEFQLIKVPGPWIAEEKIKFSGLEEFVQLSDSSDREYDYTVAWVDCLAKAPRLGRGIFIRGNHALGETRRIPAPGIFGTLKIPMDAPDLLLNRLAMRMFNTFYYLAQRHPKQTRTVFYRPFFCPLDSIDSWNRLYGRRGFFQYQCVLPSESSLDALKEIFQTTSGSGDASFLAVMKTFGEKKSPGILSFPKKGVTLTLDFANRGERTMRLLERLDGITIAFGGRVYPAKDARMSPASFNIYYPQWREFAHSIDPRFSSSFWRRVTASL